MGLTSTTFIILLPIVIFAYYIFSKRIRNYFLLLINLLFYACFGYKYLTAILSIALITYLSSILLKDKKDWELNSRALCCKRRIILCISITLMTSVLILFRIGMLVSDSIVAPLGISFYLMQAISYIVDVYKGDIQREKNYLVLLLWLSFFPTITSGPIYRYKDFYKEFRRNSELLSADYNRIINGIVYVIYGYFLKLVIAERAAIPVNKVFSEFESAEYGGILLFIIAITYSVQIYADFAGYSAIVIGIAQILGYDIPENFVAPYFSGSIKEFWSRWHISLSAWLRDYIYIPLGGNRKGQVRKYLNILITFLISGLWHGFRWHFVVWGMMHAIFQIVGEMTIKFRRKVCQIVDIRETTFFYLFLQRIITFVLVTIAWIFFRTGLRGAIKYTIEMVTTMNIGGMIQGQLWTLGLPPFGWILLGMSVLFVSVVDCILYRKKIRIDSAIDSQGSFAKCIFVIVLSLFILILGIYGDQHDPSYFVYRDF